MGKLIFIKAVRAVQVVLLCTGLLFLIFGATGRLQLQPSQWAMHALIVVINLVALSFPVLPKK